MFSRTTVAVMAYVLSSVGILLMFQLIGEELRKPRGPSVFIFVWLIAWLTHAVMTAAWVCDRKLPRAWPVVGTVAGVGSFLVWPFLAAKDAALFGADAAAASAGMLTAIQAVLVAPCILLAVWLVRFHIKTTKPIPPIPAISNGT
jgi:hypothetical protein